MQHETRSINRVIAFHHAAFVIRANQVGHLHLREVNGHRIGPVQARVFRIAHRQVTGETVIEALLRERPARSDQAFLQVLPTRCVTRERRQFREDQPFLFRLINRYLAVLHQLFRCTGTCFHDSRHLAFSCRTHGIVFRASWSSAGP